MKFTYDGTTYNGSREEIIWELKIVLYRIPLLFKNNIFYINDEEYQTYTGKYNVENIKKIIISKILTKVPVNQFEYNDKIYFGSKEQILKNIEKDLRNSFSYDGDMYYVGEERRINVFQHKVNLLLLHEEMIAKALEGIRNEI